MVKLINLIRDAGIVILTLGILGGIGYCKNELGKALIPQYQENPVNNTSYQHNP